MKAKKHPVPPYELTGRILSVTASISERIGRIEALMPDSARPLLRRTNQIRKVQASLQIEGNTLSLEQVTAVSEGRRILGAPKEVQEVRNALDAYGKIEGWNPFSLKDLCSAHKALMIGLVDSPGKFRRGSTGIARGKDIVHIAPPADRVPHLLTELLGYLEDSEDHPLVRGAVFHYEFEFIHPFTDGNGRLGRLWHTLFLSKWNPVFSLMPVESIIRDRQEAYYRALRNSDNTGRSTLFLEFMLEAIDAAISEAEKGGIPGSVKSSVKSSVKILGLITVNPKITIPEIAAATGLSTRAVEKQIASLKTSGQLRRIGPDKGGWWEVRKCGSA